MNTAITPAQVDFYQENGYVIIEDFLNSAELELWREAVATAVDERNGQKIPGRAGKTGEDDGINKDSEYLAKVFDQLINLWQTNEKVKELMFNPAIGEMAATLAQVDGIRIWHDQALFKKPWANPTSWHLDTPFWSFSDRRALSIWVALDDATFENGCLFFIPGSHKETSFENPGIGRNMDSIFNFYPSFKTSPSVAAPMKAGSCSFHNGLTIHGAHANMTPGSRRAMTCAYMPDGNTFNGIQNILSDEAIEKLKVGDLLNNDEQNPLIYSTATPGS
ncbi:phytanoyl-CoA dioxygenase family protein [Mucilaginibacter flavidus]|uniref:phytanoyl-CoA dioxygenase family protein n=1 Tax=Mucilaginibacter flavidus TaxID=2949309 RepID=UPI0020937D40|nr:phytanoyl-CoA dioxygenase family protein [Mucilaginibacter flavidus]MCO5949864.1 phytanoyl-CoA dioxygenase family protein [Mucilaginibacter flavidus]